MEQHKVRVVNMQHIVTSELLAISWELYSWNLQLKQVLYMTQNKVTVVNMHLHKVTFANVNTK